MFAQSSKGNLVIITSQHDAQQYFPLKLENGLEALIVENSQIQKCALAITVAVGHFQDPPEFPGLTHLLEHVLLQGSDSYPSDTFDFSEQLSEFSGRVNAATTSQYISFFFDCSIQYAKPVVAQFSRYLVCPEFKQEIIEREVAVLESEFKLKIRDEIRRLNDVHKNNCNPEHPFSRFSSGNHNSLMSHGIEALTEALKDHFKRAFVSNHIKLVFLSPWPVSTARALLDKHFNDIPNCLEAENTPSVPLYRPSDLALQFNIQPVKNIKRAIYTFVLDSEGDSHQNKSVSYLLAVFGDERRGSLYWELKSERLCEQLTAACGQDDGQTLDFNLSLQLTDLGLNNLERIHQIVFTYIQWLQKQTIQSSAYLDEKRLNEIEFSAMVPQKPIEWASMLATNMQLYPIKDVVFGPYRMQQMSTEWLSCALQQLCAERLRLTVLAPNLSFDYITDIYQTPYRKLSFKAPLLDQQPPLAAHFSLPGANPYIPEKLTVANQENDSLVPTKIINERACVVWFKQETQFGSAKGQVFLSLDLPNSQGNIRRHAMTRLFVEVLMDSLLEESYLARCAGLNLTLSPHQGGMTFNFSGYAEKQISLIKSVLRKVGVKTLSSEVYHHHQQRVCESFLNQKHIRPANALFRQLSNMLQNNQYDHTALAKELAQVELSEFAEFTVHLFDRINLEALICGHWNMTQALEIGEQIQKRFCTRSKPCAEVVRSVYALDLGRHSFVFKSHHNDSAVVCYYQAHENSEHNNALFMLFNEVLSPLAFNLLRKQSQLGYLVGSSYFPVNQTPGIVIYVQSDRFDSNTIRHKIHGLCEFFPEYLNKLTEENWYNVKHNLIQQIQEPITTLQASALSYWMSVGLKDTQFRHQENLIEKIKEVSLNEFIVAAKETFSAQSTDYQCLELSSEKDIGVDSFEAVKSSFQRSRNVI